MSKEQIKQLIESRMSGDGMLETGVEGVQLFRLTEPLSCAPAVYEPTLVVIVNGSKEAIFQGKRYRYDSSQYLCCAISMPVEAGAPAASREEPLLGVYISLNTRVMTELVVEMTGATAAARESSDQLLPKGIALASWQPEFTDALLRLLQLWQSTADTAILGSSRLREVYYALLKGEAGDTARRAYGVGSEIARSIEYLSAHLSESVTIDELAAQVGMSRAVFHRKFKQTTTMSPMQFVKSMRLNSAAMKIASGKSVNVAAQEVGYVSSSQFSREFKRLYGQSPKQWGQFKHPVVR